MIKIENNVNFQNSKQEKTFTFNNINIVESDIYNQVKNAVVYITAVYELVTEVKVVQSTGFFIKYKSKKNILCAANKIIDFSVFDSDKDEYLKPTSISAIILSDCKNKVVNLELVAFDGKTDIAILKTDGCFDLKNQEYLEWGDVVSANKGEKIFSVNYSDGSLQFLVNGILRNNKVIDCNITLNVEGITTNLIKSQNPNLFTTGSPILNKKGKILGIVTGYKPLGLLFGPNQKIIEPIANSMIKTKADYIKGFVGIAFSNILFSPNYFLTNFIVIGLKVTDVVVPSPANDVGFQIDDMIIRIDDTYIGDLYFHVSNVTFFKKPGDKIKIYFFRDQVLLKTELTLGVFPNLYDSPFNLYL